MITQPFRYADRATPEGYACNQCGAKGVKLWRESATFLDRVTLACAKCAIAEQSTPDVIVGPDGRHKTRHGMTDQFRNRVPAVPTEDGATFWGYTSVPRDAADWWRELQNDPAKAAEDPVPVGPLAARLAEIGLTPTDSLASLATAYLHYMQAHQAAHPPEDNWVPLVHKRPMPGPEGEALRAAKDLRREAEQANANAALMTAEAGVWRALAALFGSNP